MKLKTENYRDTKDMLGWLTCVIDEVKRHAPMADTKTLFEAREIAIGKNEPGKLKILSRELFYRLEPGDVVYAMPFDEDPVKNPNLKICKVTVWTVSGKMVKLDNTPDVWGWKDLFIPMPENMMDGEKHD